MTAAIGECLGRGRGAHRQGWTASVARNKKAWNDMVAGLEKVWPGAVAAIEGVWDGSRTTGAGSSTHRRRLGAMTGRLGEKWRPVHRRPADPRPVKRWLGMDSGPGQPAPPAPSRRPGRRRRRHRWWCRRRQHATPPGPRQGAADRRHRQHSADAAGPGRETGRRSGGSAGGRATPAAAPAGPSARPAPERHAALDIGGGVDINVRGPAEVRRVAPRDPRVPVNVNQGWSMVG